MRGTLLQVGRRLFPDLFWERMLLGNTLNHKYKIMSLAFDCGFTSKSSLIRIFKGHTGQTPSQYLESVKANP